MAVWVLPQQALNTLTHKVNLSQCGKYTPCSSVITLTVCVCVYGCVYGVGLGLSAEGLEHIDSADCTIIKNWEGRLDHKS